MVSVTSARPSGGRPAVPAKMTSSILPPRSALAPCSPSTQEIASTTLDLPDPLGPTTQVMPGSNRRLVAEAKDLKPFSVRLLRCTTLRKRTADGPARVKGPRGTVPERPSGSAQDVLGEPGTVEVTPMGACRVRTGTRERWTGSRPARTSGQNGLGQLGELPQPTLQIGRRRLAIGTQPCDLRFQVAYSRP